jgi:hypothetical protein
VFGCGVKTLHYSFPTNHRPEKKKKEMNTKNLSLYEIYNYISRPKFVERQCHFLHAALEGPVSNIGLNWLH